MISIPPPFLPLSSKESITFPFKKVVLVIIRSETVFIRLEELCRLLLADRRIQCLFTVPKPISRFDRHLENTISSYGCIVIPWDIALEHEFDLAIACSPNGAIELIDAPLIILEHGPALSKKAAASDTKNLIERLGGRQQRSILAIPTGDDLPNDPPPDINIEIVGDPIRDSMLKYGFLRPDFREVLGIGDRALIALSSTWGCNSLMALAPELSATLLSELPANEFAFALILHPYTWNAHGAWQIETWLRKELASGLILVPHVQGWQATILASDCVIGDHGSVTHYAALAQIPTLLFSKSLDESASKSVLVQRTLSRSTIVAEKDDIARKVREVVGDSARHPSSTLYHFPWEKNSAKRIADIVYSELDLEPNCDEFSALTLDLIAPTPIDGNMHAFRTVSELLCNTGAHLHASISVYPASLPNGALSYDGHLFATIGKSSPQILREADVLLVALEGAGQMPSQLLSRYPRCQHIAYLTQNGCYLYSRSPSKHYRIPIRDQNDLTAIRAAMLVLEEGAIACIVHESHEKTRSIEPASIEPSDIEDLFA